MAVPVPSVISREWSRRPGGSGGGDEKKRNKQAERRYGKHECLPPRESKRPTQICPHRSQGSATEAMEIPDGRILLQPLLLASDLPLPKSSWYTAISVLKSFLLQ